MEVEELSIPGVKLIKPKIFQDERGFFLESYHKDRYVQAGIKDMFVQDNHSFSKKNVIRGMHFQTYPGQAKLVSVVYGKIFDVVVDMRKNFSTFGTWQGILLDDQKQHQLFLPAGCAHGFCVLSEEAHVLYKVSSFYDPSTEKGFCFDDPEIGIQWPIQHPILSPRDLKNPSFQQVIVS